MPLVLARLKIRYRYVKVVLALVEIKGRDVRQAVQARVEIRDRDVN